MSDKQQNTMKLLYQQNVMFKTCFNIFSFKINDSEWKKKTKINVLFDSSLLCSKISKAF